MTKGLGCDKMKAEEDVLVGTGKDSKKFVTFELGEEEFGADVMQIKEISRMKETTSVPTAPSFVEGVINLRGTITPIIDLRRRLGLEEAEYDSETRIVIAELDDQFTGMIVDTVTDVLEIPEEDVDPTPGLVTTEVSEEYLKGVGKVGEDRLVVLLDLSRVLSREELEEVKNATDEQDVESE